MSHWLDKAVPNWAGVQEVPGPGANARIRDLVLAIPGGKWWWQTYAGGDDGKIAWCGILAGRVFSDAGIAPPAKFEKVESWRSWGAALNLPLRGCVVILKRTKGPGLHIGFPVGWSADGRLLVWGGNQGDGVRVSSFHQDQVVAYRWPNGRPITNDKLLPKGMAAVSQSAREA